jgi:aspartate aminotransferase-like enzyme
MAQPILHHRTPEFRSVLARVEENLKYVFQTSGEVFILAASGTGAMEAAVASILQGRAPVLTVEGGKFGERWGELCEAYGAEAVRHKVEWGHGIRPEEMEALLEERDDYQAIFLTHSETSTGTALNLQQIAHIIRKRSQALIVVDGITSVGALPLYMDDWGVDMVVAGSQKGFMCPPGLSFVACGERALQAIAAGDRPRYYFDLRRAHSAMKKTDTPFTPAVTLILGVDEALQMIREEGLENVWARHRRLASATRAAIGALGLPLFSDAPSDSVTAVRIPEELRDRDLVGKIKARGCIVAGGQAHLKGKIFRIAHLGYFDEGDMLVILGALEEALAECGWDVRPGAALQVFQETVDQLRQGR